MEIKTIVICCTLSALISLFIGNAVGIYYMNGLNNAWEETFKKVEEIILSEIKNIQSNDK